MSHFIKSGLILSFFLILAGCSAGKDFVRPSPDSLKLGQTTYAQIVQLMGAPSKIQKVILNNGETVDELSYVYATGSLPGGIATARSMNLGTNKEILVSKIFLSSFKEDSTDFESDKVTSIKNGKTTKEDILNWFGNPSGEGIYPFAKLKDGRSLTYLYAQSRNIGIGSVASSKMLIVQLDHNGIVVDYKFSTKANGS